MDPLFSELIQKYLANSLSRQEEQELVRLSHDAGNMEQLEAMIESDLHEGQFANGENDKLRQLIYSRLLQKINEPKVIPINWRRIAVAASVILAIGLGSYFLFLNKTGKKTEIVKIIPSGDIEAPKSTKAMITLANGQKVYLDSVTNGILAKQGNVNVEKAANGEIVYSGPSASSGSNEVVYNTLVNPRGSKVVNLTLQDGTKVWLNAESSLKYPVAFVGNERKVEITGEAYFEVEKNASMPFRVKKGEAEVEVLGTHFNVNAYEDEANIKVTLLEGSVKISKDGLTGMLKPGQQAQINSEIKLLDNADIEQAMAWKNGLFSFDRADIKTIMKEVSRWYDVNVVYNGEVKDLFRLKTSRNTSVSNIFKILETTGKVHLKVDGKTIVIQP